MRSEMIPIGHCARAPPTTAQVMNQAAWAISLDMPRVNTGASAQNAPLARPVARQPSAPSGATEKMAGMLTDTACGVSGIGDVDSATGMAAIDTSTDAIANNCMPDGSYNSVSN